MSEPAQTVDDGPAFPNETALPSRDQQNIRSHMAHHGVDMRPRFSSKPQKA